jgi:hypothetical protein
MISKKESNLILLTIALIAFGVAVLVLAIVFSVINGIALFGPDGDITSVWHWTWFVLCALVILNAIISSIGSALKR